MSQPSAKKIHFHIWNQTGLGKALSYLGGLIVEQGWTVVVSPHVTKRSLAQCRLQWLWYTEISKRAYEVGYFDAPMDPEAWHLWFVRRFLGYEIKELPDGTTERVLKSTADLSMKDFSAYLNYIDNWASSELHAQLTRPEELYNEAMGRLRR